MDVNVVNLLWVFPIDFNSEVKIHNKFIIKCIVAGFETQPTPIGELN